MVISMKKEIEIVVKKPGTHCARGQNSCEKCREAFKKYEYGLSEVLDKCKTPNATHPSFGLRIDDKPVRIDSCWIVRSFKDEKEAKEFSKKNNIKYIEMIPIRE